MSIQQFCFGKKIDFKEYGSVSSCIENVASKYPDHPAVTYDTSTIDYKSLNAAANQMAHYLVTEEHIAPGDLIGIYFTPSIELIVSILAVIKAGAAYVPLDLTYPTEFINFVIHDSNPKIILTNTASKLSNKKTKTVHIQKALIEKYPRTSPAVQLTPKSPLYVIYTSGSTGQPKGVVIPHRAAINHMLWMLAEFEFKTTDKILLKTPLAFDPSVWEIFAPLFAGAELVVAPTGSHIDTHLLLTAIVRYQITTVQFVPFLLHKFLNHKEVANCTSLQRVFVGGESLPSKTKQLFFSQLKCSFINLYGPTEATIDVAYHVLKNSPKEWEKNYIGKPIYNTDFYILDQDGNLCSTNEIGELYVGGECLGLGYLNKADLTKSSFIDNPFNTNGKIYKTGDFVRCTKNGLIEYVGRKDKQVKINGTRVELDAIVSKIMAQKNVENCLVEKNEDDGVCAYLVCYLVSENQENVDIEDIKKNLSTFFHKSVIPREFYLVEKFPVLPSGKIDIPHLRKIAAATGGNENQSQNGENNIQLDLLQTCRRFIGSNMFGMNDDLYDGGMDSLSCLLLIEHIEKTYHIDCMIHEVLSAKTVIDLADLVLKKTQCAYSNSIHNHTLIALKETGDKTPIFLIHPIGGTVFWYTHIAKHLPSDRPLYAIQDPGIESDDYFFDSLEAMAKFYFRHIKRIQPSGPYIIGGASFGATVAVEICRHLSKNEVVAIPAFDGWAIYPENLKDEDYFRESMLKQQNDWRIKFGAHGYHDFKKIFSTQRHRLELLYKYKMQKIKHNILLFKAKEIMEVFAPIDCHDNGWGKYASDNLEIVTVDGNHETMFQNDHVKNLSKKLSDFLENSCV